MEKVLKDFIEGIPKGIDSSIQMDVPNQNIKIYEGNYNLKNSKSEIIIEGTIDYYWFPMIGARFSGKTKRKQFDFDDEYDLIIDNLLVGKCHLTQQKITSATDEIYLKGNFNDSAIFGDSSINVDYILFDIPNFKKKYLGEIICKQKGSSFFKSKSRLQFGNNKYTVVLDKALDYKERIEKLEAKGGYLNLYSGKITKKNGNISFIELQDFIFCLNTFLTFLNGRRISTAFHTGYYNDEKIWTIYSNYSMEVYKYANSWTLEFSPFGYDNLFKNFSNLWSNINDKDFIISAIHWYIESNNNKGYTEGSIIMAQTALELIYNWLIIEKKSLILGEDSKNLSASNKIRLILSQINVLARIPKSFSELTEYVNTEKSIIDGPDVIVQIRNAIIHSQGDKRKKLSSLSFEVKYQALQLTIYYIELSFLYILDYKGEFNNRCLSGSYAIHSEVNVPWMI